MKIIKFIFREVEYIGEYKNESIYPLEKNNLNILPHSEKIYNGRILNEMEVKIIPPLPNNRIVYAVGENYNSKKCPLIFFKDKSNNAIILKKQMNMNIPSDLINLWVEAELGFVVSKDINYKSKHKIDNSFIFGHFLANDITATFKDEDHHLLFSKSTPGFLQIGKFIDTEYLIKDNYISLIQDNLLLRKGMISCKKTGRNKNFEFNERAY